MELNFEGIRDGAAATREEGELLYALVRSTKPKFAVETGTHKGLTASYIASALKENGEGHLHTCDPYEWGAEGNLEHLKDWVTYRQIKGVKFEPLVPIDFLFIDGFHEKKEVIAEFEHFEPSLAENATVVFHDCHDPASPEEAIAANVNGAIRALKLDTVLIPTQNRMRIYFHGTDSTK